MPFTARVELHHATDADYTTLHAAMERSSFIRRIQDGRTNIWYRLPTAEYRYEGAGSVDSVLNAAKAAAQSTGRSFAVMVTEGAVVAWDGLEALR